MKSLLGIGVFLLLIASAHGQQTAVMAATPPMGWSSWNTFGCSVTDADIRKAADALVESGMKDAGYEYVNIDDCWQGKRTADGDIQPNERFPDMKALAKYVHSKGLKIGIYSSPGPQTCAKFEGSYGHEAQDAATYAAWGFDFLKYDWCYARLVYTDDRMPIVYKKMGDALKATGRPIVYSLCQYGRLDVWNWGASVGGNLWRTTQDIVPTIQSVMSIGFLEQAGLEPYAGPGHWNDPDMLEIGNGHLSLDEDKLHFTVWAMLAAPLIAGNDLTKMNGNVKDVLVNSDVIRIDQDVLGAQGHRLKQTGPSDVWAKPLAGGDMAVALFNLGESPRKMSVDLKELGITGSRQVRDLWQHRALGAVQKIEADVPVHGVVVFRISETKS